MVLDHGKRNDAHINKQKTTYNNAKRRLLLEYSFE